MGLLEKIFKKTPKRNKETGTAIQRYWKSFNHAIDGIIYVDFHQLFVSFLQ